MPQGSLPRRRPRERQCLSSSRAQAYARGAQPLVAVVGRLVGVAAKQRRHFGLDGLCQKRSRAVAQDLGQRVRKSSWLGELENVSVGLGVSLLQWRNGGFGTPHDTPPYPLMPSPTFAHSSSLVGWLMNEAGKPWRIGTHHRQHPCR